jgi:hypothetical protein
MTDNSDDKEFEAFTKRYMADNRIRITAQERTLTQKEIDICQEVWKREFTSKRGRYKKEHFDSNKENSYKNCLFAIYKYHWDDVDGFQLDMKRLGVIAGKSVQTVDRILLFLLECGLLVRCHNYMVGKQTYFYHKNAALFKHLFCGETNEYTVWINSKKSNTEKTVDNSFKHSNNISVDVITNKRGRKTLVYKADTKLYNKIQKDFLSIYDELNAGRHEDLQINFGLHFDSRGNYSGRSSSYFCFTLNEKKKENSDSTMERRSDFLKRVGLAGYKELYDIKSEVPRTTILANTGIWKSDDYDIYTEIIRKSEVQEINREVIKELYMRFNFGTGSMSQRFNYYRNYRIKTLQKECGWDCKSCDTFSKCGHHNSMKCKKHKQAEELYYVRLQDIMNGKYEISYQLQYGTSLEYTHEEWVALGKAIEEIQGESWGNLIFWWTSLIQVYSVYQIWKEKNIRVYNVYDGFYGSGEAGITKDYIRKVVKESALYIYKNYIKEVADKR